jgi:hypothetical protein
MRNLDDDLPLEFAVPGQVDGAHPTAIEGFLDLVTIVQELADEPVLFLFFLAACRVVQARPSS